MPNIQMLRGLKEQWKTLGLVFVFIVAISSTLFAQNRQYGGQGRISGAVFDSTSNQPIEYANIVLFSSRDSSQVDGTITDPNGQFELTQVRPGNYFMEVRFIGYKDKRIAAVNINPQQPQVNFGTIYLRRAAINTKGLVVNGTTPAMEYKIDRKVIDVSQQKTSVTGSAIDILENVPSVRVDIEGNVSLRGSESFTVLIDGKPTVLEGSEALQQIPVASIKTIEIITNPSAKYDPEGTSGIINVVLKKEKFAGSSGMFNLSAGWDHKYDGNALYSYKNDNYTVTLNADYGQRYFNGSQIERRSTSRQGTTTYINSGGSSTRGRDGGGLRAALEYNFTPTNQLTLNGRYGNSIWESNSETGFREWTGSNPDPADITHYISNSQRSRDGSFYDLNATFLHQFNQDGHEFTAEFSHDRRDGTGTTLNELRNQTGQITDGSKTKELGPSSDYELRLDYVYPHGKNRKFETGYELESESSDETSQQYRYNTDVNEYQLQDRYSYTTINKQNTQSIYSLYSNEIGRFGYQLGVRGEYTYRDISHPDSASYFKLDRWDYFPSLHTSFSITENNQIMASYSRRINRPRSWFLEPFLTWEDAYNVRQGNPKLIPEYIDSYELGFQTRIGQSVFNFETYYRQTHNKIERVQTVYQAADNVVLHTMDNVGSDYSLGSEFNIRYNLMRFWNLNLMGDLYQYRVVGDFGGQSFDHQSFTWSSRINNTFKLGKSWQIQWDGMYRSPSVSAQGRREGYFRSNLAVGRDFFDKKLTATLQVRDLFDTANWESSSQGPGFSSYSYNDMASPIVMLNLKFNINNYRERRGQPQGNTGGGAYDGAGIEGSPDTGAGGY